MVFLASSHGVTITPFINITIRHLKRRCDRHGGNSFGESKERCSTVTGPGCIISRVFCFDAEEESNDDGQVGDYQAEGSLMDYEYIYIYICK